MSVFITTESDLRTWLDGAMGPDATADIVSGVVEDIKLAGHPAWGSDWTGFLDSIDPWGWVEEGNADG